MNGSFISGEHGVRLFHQRPLRVGQGAVCLGHDGHVQPARVCRGLIARHERLVLRVESQ